MSIRPTEHIPVITQEPQIQAALSQTKTNCRQTVQATKHVLEASASAKTLIARPAQTAELTAIQVLFSAKEIVFIRITRHGPATIQIQPAHTAQTLQQLS